MEWNIDPIIFGFGPFQIRYYGLMFAAGFFLGYRSMFKIYEEEHKPTKDLDMLLYMIIAGTLIGARLGHCFFYEFDYFIRHPLEVFAFWKGGLASHGGAIGVMIAIFIYTKVHKDQPFFWLADRLARPVALVACFIRIGNFFNSEILGKPTDLPWAVTFKRIDDLPRHPSMLYESAAYFVLYLILSFINKRYRGQTPQGLIPGLFFTWIFTARILIEFTKENQEAWEAGMVMNMGQILSIPAILFGLGMFYYAYKHPTPATAPKSKRV